MKAAEVLRSVNDVDELGDGGNQLPISSLTVNNRLIFVSYLSCICLFLSCICLVFVSGKGLLMISHRQLLSWEKLEAAGV